MGPLGVVIETGHVRARREELVHAGAVVSNADMRQTVEQAARPGTSCRRSSSPVFAVYGRRIRAS